MENLRGPPCGRRAGLGLISARQEPAFSPSRRVATGLIPARQEPAGPSSPRVETDLIFARLERAGPTSRRVETDLTSARQKPAGPSSRRAEPDAFSTRQKRASPPRRRVETDAFSARRKYAGSVDLVFAPRTRKALPPTGADSRNQSLSGIDSACHLLVDRRCTYCRPKQKKVRLTLPPSPRAGTARGQTPSGRRPTCVPRARYARAPAASGRTQI